MWLRAKSVVWHRAKSVVWHRAKKIAWHRSKSIVWLRSKKIAWLRAKSKVWHKKAKSLVWHKGNTQLLLVCSGKIMYIFGKGDLRHFRPMCLLSLTWCRECFAACVVFLFFSSMLWQKYILRNGSSWRAPVRKKTKHSSFLFFSMYTYYAMVAADVLPCIIN